MQRPSEVDAPPHPSARLAAAEAMLREMEMIQTTCAVGDEDGATAARAEDALARVPLRAVTTARVGGAQEDAPRAAAVCNGGSHAGDEDGSSNGSEVRDGAALNEHSDDESDDQSSEAGLGGAGKPSDGGDASCYPAAVVASAEAMLRAAVSSWRDQYDEAMDRVSELEEVRGALPPSPVCLWAPRGKPAGQADIRPTGHPLALSAPRPPQVLEASGVCLTALEAAITRQRQRELRLSQRAASGGLPSGPTVRLEKSHHGQSSVSGCKQILCEKCHKRPAINGPPESSAETAGGTAALEGSAADDSEGEEAASMRALCCVCSAEAAMEARQPSLSRHGQVVAVGASGFTGWVQGMRRTKDTKVLKAMYTSELPQQVTSGNGDLGRAAVACVMQHASADGPCCPFEAAGQGG